MFSNLKKVSAICIVFSIICAVAAILCIMLLAPEEYMDGILMTCIIAFTGCSVIISLFLSFTLWNLASELNIHTDSNYEDISNLKKRVDQLEKK